MGWENQPEYIPFFDCFCHNIAPSIEGGIRTQGGGTCKLISIHKDDGVPLGSAKQERKLYFHCSGLGVLPSPFCCGIYSAGMEESCGVYSALFSLSDTI